VEPKPTETPETQTSETPQQVASHVDAAQQGASSVATETGESVWKSIADELKGLRNDIGKLLTGSTPAPETPAAAAETPAAAAAPNVTIEAPAKQEYHVRRNGRKVRREK
jgi:hypothetical protein